MSQIPANQGAVKTSEVASDTAQPLLATLTQEDLDTVVTQIRKVLTDALKRSAGGLLLTSRNAVGLNPGSMTWTGTQIIFTTNTDMVIRLIQNESGSMVQLRANYGASNTAVTFNNISLASGEVLYVELDRSLIPGSGDLVLENAVGGGSIVIGKTLKIAAAGPLLADALSGASGTLSVPLAINVDGHLWWIPHGIYWPPNTSSPLGAVVTSTSLPIGAVIDYHTFGAASPLGYSATKLVSPGFQLCDGSVIIDPSSPFFNPTRNADGTPTLSYNSALDIFTPNMIGEHITWVLANTYSEGSYVINAGTRYVAIQSVPASTLITNTAYWVTEATYNNTSPANPYNKYRKTTQNQGNNTYSRGNNQSFAAESASGYGGANTHTLITAELPAHSHTGSGSTGGQSANHSHSQFTYNVNDQNWTHVPPEGPAADSSAGRTDSGTQTGGASNDHTHSFSFTTSTTGSGTAHNNEPRYMNLLKLVRIY